MRVAVIYHFYPHYRRAIVEALARSDAIDFTFIGDDHEYLHSIAPATFSDAVDFKLAPTHHLIGPFMWQWGAIKWAIAPGFGAVIMHAVPHWPCTWVGALLARLLGRRVYFWGHGFLYEPAGLKGFARKLFYSIAHEHLFYGARSKRIAASVGWPAERLHVIRNSLDAALQRRLRNSVSRTRAMEVRRQLFGEASSPVVICTSRLIKLRGLDMLVRAMGNLRRTGHLANLILVGDGPERRELARLAEQQEVPVHFEGETYAEERIAELFCASTVTVAPGKVGLTAIHSMSYGVPVISHDDPDQQMPEWEAIHPGATGDTFRRGDLAQLEDCIRRWTNRDFPDPTVQRACIEEVEARWTPEIQRSLIEQALRASRSRNASPDTGNHHDGD
jgi:glycosyltransferase involved in cell wall biosynthesis